MYNIFITHPFEIDHKLPLISLESLPTRAETDQIVIEELHTLQAVSEQTLKAVLDALKEL